MKKGDLVSTQYARNGHRCEYIVKWGIVTSRVNEHAGGRKMCYVYWNNGRTDLEITSFLKVESGNE